jgi:hypothetical protein
MLCDYKMALLLYRLSMTKRLRINDYIKMRISLTLQDKLYSKQRGLTTLKLGLTVLQTGSTC